MAVVETGWIGKEGQGRGDWGEITSATRVLPRRPEFLTLYDRFASAQINCYESA